MSVRSGMKPALNRDTLCSLSVTIYTGVISRINKKIQGTALPCVVNNKPSLSSSTCA